MFAGIYFWNGHLEIEAEEPIDYQRESAHVGFDWEDRMDRWPTGWRFWLLIVLLFAFPLVLHPWWLFIISAAVYALLVWVVGRQKRQDSPLPRRYDGSR